MERSQNSSNMVKIITECEREIRKLYNKMHDEKDENKKDEIYDDIKELKIVLYTLKK